MQCHYCEEDIQPSQEVSTLQNKTTNQVVHVHYPDCKVRFTTFGKTKKEFEAWKENGYAHDDH